MSDPSSPPPAYEITQQEYDRKTNDVLHASAEADEDEWESWDDARYEAASQRLQNDLGMASSSTAAHLSQYPAFSTDHIQPLKIQKKAASAKKEKERPRWLTDPGSSPPLLRADSQHLSTHTHSAGQISGSSASHLSQPFSSDDEARHHDAIAPPPFSSHEPTYQMEVTPPVLTYDGNTSNPPSPLASPMSRRTPLPTPPPLPPLPLALERERIPDESTPNPHRHTLPVTRRYTTTASSRPSTGIFTYSAIPPPPPLLDESRSGSSLPRMQFDTSLAYRGRRGDAQPAMQLESPPYESFYNSAVTPFLSKKPTAPTGPAVPPPPPAQAGQNRITSQYYYSTGPLNSMSPGPPDPSTWMNPQLQYMPTQTQYNQSYPTPMPTVPDFQPGANASSWSSHPSYSVPQQGQPPSVMQAPGVGGQVQGPYASSEQQMMWDVYSTRH